MPFKFTGVAEMRAVLKRIDTDFPNRVGAALYQEAQIEMTEAKRRTPVWNPARSVPAGHTPGSLRASGQVHPPERDGKKLTVTLSFGNEFVDYAIYVHEDLDAEHATGQPLFLSSTLDESATGMADRLARRLKL